jgi:uncharacterized membrane protein YhaH (DUF805 family)
VLAVVLVIVEIVVLLVFGGNATKFAAAAANDPAMAASLAVAGAQTSGWIGVVILVIFGWPIYCLAVKRRHDKDNNGLDVIGYLVLVAIVDIVQGLGLGMTVLTVGEVTTPVPTLLFSILAVVMLIYGIYLLVVLGFLKGTAGANQYGADPLGRSAMAAA